MGKEQGKVPFELQVAHWQTNNFYPPTSLWVEWND